MPETTVLMSSSSASIVTLLSVVTSPLTVPPVRSMSPSASIEVTRPSLTETSCLTSTTPTVPPEIATFPLASVMSPTLALSSMFTSLAFLISPTLALPVTETFAYLPPFSSTLMS